MYTYLSKDVSKLLFDINSSKAEGHTVVQSTFLTVLASILTYHLAIIYLP